MNTVIPNKPSYVMPMNFIFSDDVNVAIQIINELLQKDSSLSSDFNGVRWNITLVNDRACELTRCALNIYHDNNVYIFEAKQLGGEKSFELINLFNRISNTVIGTALREDISFTPSRLYEHIKLPPLTEERALDAIRPTLILARNVNKYYRNMGLQMLCETISEGNRMRPYFAKFNCIPLLVNAIYANDSRLSAIIALTHLTDNNECIQDIRDAMHTPVLFGNDSDDRLIQMKYDNLIRILYPEQCAEMSM